MRENIAGVMNNGINREGPRPSGKRALLGKRIKVKIKNKIPRTTVSKTNKDNGINNFGRIKTPFFRKMIDLK